MRLSERLERMASRLDAEVEAAHAAGEWDSERLLVLRGERTGLRAAAALAVEEGL